MIGVLAIQGDFCAHARMLQRVGLDAIHVRTSAALGGIEGLIIPGGESTTMLKFIEEESLGSSIIGLARQGKPIFGTCAGAILLAREVYNPPQASLGLTDIAVERNGYGRQVDSFIADVETTLEGGPIQAVFIRAPRITRPGDDVEVLASFKGEPVLLRERNILTAAFHPELTDDTRVHRLFAEMVQTRQTEVTLATL